jgi:uncharacterized protein YdaU (DUF1376 family)
MAEFPALPLWTDAYLADTRGLSTFEHGAYLLLLMTAWRTPDCSLPDDDRQLARWAGTDARNWARIKPTVMQFWDWEAGKWRQKRLGKEREYVTAVSDKKRLAGRSGGIAKALKEKRSELAQPDFCHSSAIAPTPTPTPTPIGSRATKEKDYYYTGSVIRLTRPDFEKWAAAFPLIYDLNAELTSIDAWLASQPDGPKRWFHRTAAMLNKRQQAMARETAAPPQSGDGFVARVGF